MLDLMQNFPASHAKSVEETRIMCEVDPDEMLAWRDARQQEWYNCVKQTAVYPSHIGNLSDAVIMTAQIRRALEPPVKTRCAIRCVFLSGSGARVTTRAPATLATTWPGGTPPELGDCNWDLWQDHSLPSTGLRPGALTSFYNPEFSFYQVARPTIFLRPSLSLTLSLSLTSSLSITSSLSWLRPLFR